VIFLKKSTKSQQKKEVKSLIVYYFTDKSCFFFLVLTVCAGSGLAIISNVGLDASWWVLTVEAARFDQNRTGEFIGTFGPLGFLDFTLIYWKLGLILGILFKILVSVILFTLTKYLLDQRINSQNFFNGLLTFIFVYLANYFLPPSQVIVLLVIAFWVYQKINKREISQTSLMILGFVTSFLLLIKVFPGALVLVLSLSIILGSNVGKNHSKKMILQSLSKYLFMVCFSSFSILLFLGYHFENMSNWFFGYYQMLRGYRAMATEEPGRLWEYYAFLVLIILLLYKFRKHNSSLLVLSCDLAFLYLIFTYGFIRHDVHSTTTFVILSSVFFYIYLTEKKSNPVQYGLSILILIAVSGVSFLSLLDLSKPISNTVTLLKVQEKNFSENYKASNVFAVRSVYALSPDMIRIIGNASVSIYPVDQVAAKGWNLNLQSPPSPQLITAYTEWLDSRNVDWIKSSKASRYMLWSTPRSIDGRNPHWDSPNFQLETICNYQQILSDNNWILLEKRKSSICGERQVVTRISNRNENRNDQYEIPDNLNGIITMSVEEKFSFFERALSIIFKPFRQDYISLDDQSFYYLRQSGENLIISVAPEVDFPTPYSYGQRKVLIVPEDVTFTIFFTPTSYVSENFARENG
jgi:hypothetical protein